MKIKHKFVCLSFVLNFTWALMGLYNLGFLSPWKSTIVSQKREVLQENPGFRVYFLLFCSPLFWTGKVWWESKVKMERRLRGTQLSLNQTQKVRLQRALQQLESLSSKVNSNASVTVADSIPVNYEDGVLKYPLSLSNACNSESWIGVFFLFFFVWKNHVLVESRGHGTSELNGEVVATVCGVVERVNKLVYVRALRARYKPEVGDIIVGRVVEVFSELPSLSLSVSLNVKLLLLHATGLMKVLRRHFT